MNRAFNISQILVYYDMPELFISVDEINTHYLCMLVEPEDDIYRYLTIPISENRIAQFISGKIDLYEIYVNPEINSYFFLSIDENELVIDSFHIQDVKEEWLPSEGFFLNTPFQDDSIIVKEVVSKDNAVIHLALSDSRDDFGIDTDDLGDLVKLYSVLLENSYKKALTEHNVNNKKQFIIPENYKVRAFLSSAASFNLHLYSESQKDIFGNCMVEYGLEKIDEIFSEYETEEDLIKKLRTIKGHAVSSYTKILKKISSDNLKLKHKWYAPNRESINYKIIDKNKADDILEILQKTEELTEEVKEFIGFFVQVDIVRRTWKLRTDEGKDIFGEASNEEQLKGLTIETIQYKIVCEEIIEEFKVSEKERIKYIVKTVSIID